MTKKKQKPGHGGHRAGSGKPTFFRKRHDASGTHSSILTMSQQAFDKADARRAQLSTELSSSTRPKGTPNFVSRNVFVETLIEKYGDTIKLSDIFRIDRG